MIKRWIQATLITLGLAAGAQAQMPPPPGAGGPFYPPTFANSPAPMDGPQFCPAPGPGTQEPDSPFSLKRDGSPNAFDDDCPGCGAGQGFYVHIGGMGLMRQGLNSSVLAYKDPGSNIAGLPANFDSGNQAPLGSPVIANFNNVQPGMTGGVRAAAGWREGQNAFEISGFYVGQQTSTASTISPGGIDVLFGVNPAPLGFQNTNNLWLQSDIVRQQLKSQLGSGEANYRYSTSPGFDFLFGVRYVYFQDNYSVLTDDDGIVRPPSNPRSVATVGSNVTNNIVAPQLGFEFTYPILSRFALGINGKGAWGADFMSRNYTLQRGDGFVGFDSHRTSTYFSQVYELGVFADFLLWDQIKVRAGYMALWLLDLPESTQQIDFNLSNPNGTGTHTGSVFFHGPMVEVQIAF